MHDCGCLPLLALQLFLPTKHTWLLTQNQAQTAHIRQCLTTIVTGLVGITA